MKLAICWIGIGDYSKLFNMFYDSFNKNFCTEQERTFFIFTDNDNLIDKINCKENYGNCLAYKVSHACRNIGYVIFRKFKYLMMAEDKFLDYDYIIFCNSNMVAERSISFHEIDPGEKDISVTPHPCDSKIINGKEYLGTAAERIFKDWIYIQSCLFIAKSRFFLKLANAIESMRMVDKVNNATSRIPWQDESYFNSFMYDNSDSMRILPYLLYNNPTNWKQWDGICTRHEKPAKDKIAITYTRKENYGVIKGRYRDFKKDLY